MISIWFDIYTIRYREAAGSIARVRALTALALTLFCVPLAWQESAAPAESGATAITAVGDMAMAPATDGARSFFDGARRYLRGDVVLGNLEGTLAMGGASKCGASSTDCFAFQAPPSYARALAEAGFTILNLANNHAFDFGKAGQVETVKALRGVGLRYTGLPGQITVLAVGETRVAVLGFAAYPWAQSLLDIAAAKRMVRKAGRRADLVVVTMHAGAEGSDKGHVRAGTEWFLGENRGDSVRFAHGVVDAGADLVVGHGPHVLRGIEWYRGRLIAYSLGNFLGNGTLSISGPNGVSSVLKVRLRPDGSWVGGSLVPIRLVSPGLPRLDRGKEAHDLVRDLSDDDFGRHAVRIGAKGALLPPD
jgi:hypothetical protein